MLGQNVEAGRPGWGPLPVPSAAQPQVYVVHARHARHRMQDPRAIRTAGFASTRCAMKPSDRADRMKMSWLLSATRTLRCAYIAPAIGCVSIHAELYLEKTPAGGEKVKAALDQHAPISSLQERSR